VVVVAGPQTKEWAPGPIIKAEAGAAAEPAPEPAAAARAVAGALREQGVRVERKAQVVRAARVETSLTRASAAPVAAVVAPDKQAEALAAEPGSGAALPMLAAARLVQR
jgi:hypothetical protein